MSTFKKAKAALNLIQIRHDHRKCQQFSHGDTHEAVIVLTQVSARKWADGVQYWTPEMIAGGININTDGSTSYLVEALYMRPVMA